MTAKPEPLPATVVIDRVLERMRSYNPGCRLLVAFSGGVDSSVVLALAIRAHGREAVTAVTALSPSYPAGELDLARRLAQSLGVEHVTLETGEVDQETYARNDALRCFHCKTELYARLQRFAQAIKGALFVILCGANADDAGDFRPGLLAAGRFGVRSPLLEEGVDKAMVRAMATDLALPVAEKPELACLASRVSYGIRVTPDILSRIDRAEQAVRELGYPSVRVRHLGEWASVEVSPAEVHRLRDDPRRPRLLRRLAELGWERVIVNPDGLLHGALNSSLRITPALQRALAELGPAGART